MLRSNDGGVPVMARILAAVAVWCALMSANCRAGDGATDGFADADRVAIRSVIEAQLAALKKDDGPLAFSYSSPSIQEKFGTAEHFLYMVKTGFPSVYRPREVQFRELETHTDMPRQSVFFIGPDGEPVLGIYLMQRQPDGTWKINGCTLTAAPDISV
jgi:hypothetical protein